MRKCVVCKNTILTGGVVRDGQDFCRRRCMLARYPLWFCDLCVGETLDEGTGNLGTFNGNGTTLRDVGGIPPCPHCGSQVARVWYKLFFIPVFPLQWYRVQWVDKSVLTGSEYLARRLRDESIPGRS